MILIWTAPAATNPIHTGSVKQVKRALLIAVLTGLTLPAAAPAATTVGSSLRQRADLYVRCSSICTAAQSARPGGAGLTVPVDGIITRWRVRAATLGMARLRVVRQDESGGWTAVGKSDWFKLDRPHAPGEDVLYTFPAQIRVRPGDAIALDRDAKAGGVFHSYGTETSYAVTEFSPPLEEDAVARQPTSQRTGRELLLNADVENDGDADGFGDESQDNCPTIPNDQSDRPCTTETPQTGPTQPTSETIGNEPRRTQGDDGPPVQGERPIARGERRHGRRRGARARPPRAGDPLRRHRNRPGARRAPRRPAREEAGRHRDGPGSRPRPVRRRESTERHDRGTRRPKPPATRAPSGREHARSERRARPPQPRERPARRHRRRPSRPAPNPPPPPGWQSHG